MEFHNTERKNYEMFVEWVKGGRKEGCETARYICCIGRNVRDHLQRNHFYIGMESEGGGVNLNL